jgi:RNA polymerase sigma-70 factor (ECF subfamily)
MDQDTPSFDDMIARLRRGDPEAARDLIEKYGDTVRRFIRVRMTDPAIRRQMDSIDVCQSVMADFFVRTATGAYEFESPDQLVGLLATMARNRVINHGKRQRAIRRDVKRLEGADVGGFQPVAPGESPSQIVAGRDLLTAFRSRLTAEERELADRRSSGEEWADIARALGGTPDALRVKLKRACERVSAEMGLDGSRYE